MCDNEIMEAIGMDADFLNERPQMGSGRKSFLQKLNEKTPFFVHQIRHKREGFGRRESMRSPTPSNYTKGIFTAAPVAAFTSTKTERSPTELALRYDDLKAEKPPAPTTVKPLPPAPEEKPKVDDSSSQKSSTVSSPFTRSRCSSTTDLVAPRRSSVRRVDSSHSFVSNSGFKPATLRISSASSHMPSFDRPRTSPCEMSDQELDDWLDKPIDADLHRELKRSADYASSGSQTSSDDCSLPTLDEFEPWPEKRGTSWMNDWFSDSFASDFEGDVDEDLKSWQISSTFLKTSRRNVVVIARSPVTLVSLPEEALRIVCRHLDNGSIQNLRHTCKKINAMVPARSQSTKTKEP